MSNWESPDQAFQAGMLLGLLSKYGIEANPMMDDDQNYINSIVIRADDLIGTGFDHITIRVINPSPRKEQTE